MTDEITRLTSMPIYEYRCESCKAGLEKLQKISDPPLLECPECGQHSLVKLISASSFRLKGSGWYETDFKTGNKKNGTGEDTATKSSESGAEVKEATSGQDKDTKKNPATGNDAATSKSTKSDAGSSTKETGKTNGNSSGVKSAAPATTSANSK